MSLFDPWWNVSPTSAFLLFQCHSVLLDLFSLCKKEIALLEMDIVVVLMR